MSETINKIARTKAKLSQKLNRDPEDEEVAKEMGMTVEKLRVFLRVCKFCLNLFHISFLLLIVLLELMFQEQQVFYHVILRGIKMDLYEKVAKLDILDNDFLNELIEYSTLIFPSLAEYV